MLPAAGPSRGGGGLQKRLSVDAFLVFLQQGVEGLDLDRLQISKRDKAFRCVRAGGRAGFVVLSQVCVCAARVHAWAL